MSISDWIGLGAVGAGLLAFAWGICSWSIDKYERVQGALHKSERESLLAIMDSISKTQDKIQERLDRWEQTQSNQINASMQKFQVMEMALKDYSKDLYMVSEQTKLQRAEIEKLWTTVVKDIGEGLVRVSGKKF